MPSLHAGKKVCNRCNGKGYVPESRRDCRACDGSGREDEFYRVELRPVQLEQLGFPPKAKLHQLKIGCGMDACAYDIPGSDSVIKVTKDKRDAVAAKALMAMDPFPLWAIPIRAVYRLSGDIFVLVLAKAGVPLPPEWGVHIEEIFQDSADEKKHGTGGLLPHEWRTSRGYDGWMHNINLANAERGENEMRRHLKRALELINDMMTDLAALGLDGSDFHPGNWGMYQGRPVLIDFGMATLRDRNGKPVPPTAKVKIGDAKGIPVLLG